MSFRKVILKGVINTCSGSNMVFCDGISGQNPYPNTISGAGQEYGVCADGTNNTANPINLLFPPISFGVTKRVSYVAPQAEVQQVVTIGASTLRETVVASTNYTIEIAAVGQDKETMKTRVSNMFNYESPAILTGNVQTDRLNMYTALASNINNSQGVDYCTAYVLYEIPFTAYDGNHASDTNAGFTIGETITQAASNATATIFAITITSGSLSAGNAVGFMYIGNVVGTLDVTTTRVWTGGTSTATASGTSASTIYGVGLGFVDLAGYYLSSLERGGYNTYFAEPGFSVNTVVVQLAAAYAIGQGTVMLANQAVFRVEGTDIVKGEYEQQFNIQPIAGRQYYTVTIEVLGNIPNTDGVDKIIHYVYVFYVAHVDSTDTNWGNFIAALLLAAAN